MHWLMDCDLCMYNAMPGYQEDALGCAGLDPIDPKNISYTKSPLCKSSHLNLTFNKSLQHDRVSESGLLGLNGGHTSVASMCVMQR